MQPQILINFIKAKPWYWLAASYCLAIPISFFLNTPDTTPINLNAREDEWQQVSFSTPRTQNEHIEYLKNNPIWTTKADSHTKSELKKQSNDESQAIWTLKGVISQGNAFIAIIEQNDGSNNQNRSYHRLSTGAKLANGEEIVSIQPGSITIEMPDKTRTDVRLYQSQTTLKPQTN